MSMHETYDRIPGHLRQYVVQQDYGSYDEIDQAVWRFTLMQTYQQLKDTAHPAYVKGLNQAGIYLDHIPRIEEMNDCLSAFGWGAVCVDGFIPPRAFQEFQALGVLTINAPIRRADNLSYTPSPDIIHEAAGHAPIIPDPVYGAFLRRFGKLGRLAFASVEDRAVYEAIRQLSAIKENTGSSAAEIDRAMLELWQANDAVTFTSEASFLSRFHWWTVEYGLVGTPEDYKIYGAGILSSVGESMMLHLPEVKKMRLRSRCVETDYDITEQQPQLFVTEDFAQLDEILDQVVVDFAFRVGGKLGLQRALASGEVGTVKFNSGLQVIGTLQETHAEHSYLSFSGPCALAFEDKILPGHERDRHPQGYGTPLGRLDDGSALSSLTEYDLGRFKYKGPGSPIRLHYRCGVRLEGRLDKVATNRDGCLMLLTFSDCKVTLGDKLLFDPGWGEYDLGVGEMTPCVHAGAVDESYWPRTEFSQARCPKEKQYGARGQQLLRFYQQAIEAWKTEGAGALPVFERITATLVKEYPDHWLLAWNLLECLVSADRGVQLASKLKAHMLAIEEKDFSHIPVTLGLKNLGLA